MSSETQIILRHSAPSLLDSLPYGTACKVTKEDKFDLYCQTNKNEHEYPNWMFIGTFDKEVGQFIIAQICFHQRVKMGKGITGWAAHVVARHYDLAYAAIADSDTVPC